MECFLVIIISQLFIDQLRSKDDEIRKSLEEKGRIVAELRVFLSSSISAACEVV